jgi:hypothetical protein
MLKIGKHQMKVIDDSVEEAYARDMVRYLREEHAEDVERYSDEDLRRRVDVAIARAVKYELTWDESITAFVAIMFAVAPNFDEQPAIRAVMNDERVPPNLRIDALWDRTSDEDWEDAARLAETAEDGFWRAALNAQTTGR